MKNKHRYFGAIFTIVKYLFGFVKRWIESINFRLVENLENKNERINNELKVRGLID